MKYTFERTLSPELVSPGEQFFHNIVGRGRVLQRPGERDHGHRRSGQHADHPPDRASGRLPDVPRDAVHLCGADRPSSHRANRPDSFSRAVLHLVLGRSDPDFSPSAGTRTTTALGPRDSTRTSTTSTRTPRQRIKQRVLSGVTGLGRRRLLGRSQRSRLRPRQPRGAARAPAVVRRSVELRRLDPDEHRAVPVCGS